jgi:tetratricopeptide (TPR) repeat protein
LLVGAAVSAWQAVKASHAALAAQTAQATAESRAAETEAVLKFFSSRVFEVARPQGMDGALGRDVTLRQAIEAALPHMQTDLQGQPLAEARLRSTLGFTLKALDDQAMAATQFLRAKELFTAQLGSDHPLTLDALDGLAGSYHLLGRYEEAITLREASLRLTKEKFGPDHPLTHASSTWLAQSYCLAGRLPEACRLLEETLCRQQASFGSDNSDTLESKSSLGSVYLEMGRIQDAAAMLEEVLAQEERSYPRHPRKLVTMGALARAYDELGRHDEACTLFEKAVQLQEQTLGRDHLQTLIDMSNLAVCYRELERYEDSLTLNQEILRRAEAKLGREHAMTLGVAHNLACDYQELQRDDEAVRILEELLPRLQTVLGADHRQTLLSMQGLANSYLALERCADALRILDDALARAGQNAGQSELVPGLLQVRFRLFRKTKDVSGFQDTLRQWEAIPPRTADELFAAACAYAVGAELSGESDKAAAASQAEQAIAWLKRAIAAGWKDGVRLQEEPDLNLLRDRADFQTLLAELNAEQVLPPDPEKVQNPPTSGDNK